MAKTKQQKQELLQTYEDYLKRAKAVYLATTQLNVNETNDLKKKLLQNDSRYAVVKNTLFRIAAKGVLGEDLGLEGQHSALFCLGDVVEPAKMLSALKKEEKAKYALCILDGKVIDLTKIDALANLETKEQLLGKLMYLVNYPATGLARALSNNMERLLYALNAVKDTKQ